MILSVQNMKHSVEISWCNFHRFTSSTCRQSGLACLLNTPLNILRLLDNINLSLRGIRVFLASQVVDPILNSRKFQTILHVFWDTSLQAANSYILCWTLEICIDRSLYNSYLFQWSLSSWAAMELVVFVFEPGKEKYPTFQQQSNPKL